MSRRNAIAACLPIPLALACAELSTGDDALRVGADAALEAGEEGAALPAEEDEETGPFWEPVGDLDAARSHHAASLITAFGGAGGPRPVEAHDDHDEVESPLAREGHVLAAGGYGEGGEPLGTSEIYDPEAGLWAAGPELFTPRVAPSGAYFHDRAQDFRMFLVGGEGPEGAPLASVERYSATSETWQFINNLETPRVGHTVEVIYQPGLFRSELIIAAGGSDGDELLGHSEGLFGGERSAEFDAAMIDARRDHASVFDPMEAAVIVSGGEGSDGLLQTAEIFYVFGGAAADVVEPQNGPSWFPRGELNEARKYHTMTVLPPRGPSLPSSYLVAGGVGDDGERLSSAEIYREGFWTDAGEMNFARAEHTATLLPDRRVLVVGGSDHEDARPEIYDPNAGPEEDAWTLLDDLPCDVGQRYAHTATLLGDDSLLVAGGASVDGANAERLASTERYALEGGLLAQGDVCSVDCQCESGACVDGFCCDAACEGACEACDLEGDEGTCTVRDAGSEGVPACEGDLLCDGSAGICLETCSAASDCAGDLVCDDGACVEPPECTVDQDCAESEACENGICVEAPECTIDADCGDDQICEAGACVTLASAEGLVGWSCSAAGNSSGGAAGASILAIGLFLAARGSRRRAGSKSGRGAAAAGLAAGALFLALSAPASAEGAAANEGGAESANDRAQSALVSADGTESRAFGPGPASRLRIGAGVVAEAVAGNVGLAGAVGYQLAPWFDVGADIIWGDHPGGRLTATIEPFDLGAVDPFVQARFGGHSTGNGVRPALGGMLGAAIDAGPGRLRAGVLSEYFGDHSDFYRGGAGAMLMYELGPASRSPAAQPEPVVVERIVEVEAEPPPLQQAIRGQVFAVDGSRIDAARVELQAEGADEALEVWESSAFERNLEPGSYVLSIEAADYRPRSYQMTVEPGETVVYHAVLTEKPVERAVAQVTEQRIEVNQKIDFELDSARLRTESHGILDEVGRVLTEHPDLRIRVEGHTDTIGESAYNLRLSQQRAASVVEYLVEYGIDSGRLESEGFGDTRPIADNDTAEGRAQNRRVQFEILE